MEIGKLDQKITLESLSESNDFGELTKSYILVGEVWAHVISEKGSESFEASRLSSKEVIKVLIRYRSDVLTDWRITWSGNTYNVTHVDRSLRRDGQLWLMCETLEAE